MDSDDTPKPKKAKAAPHQAGLILQAEVSIIEIDDDDDQQAERLNKMSPTADVKAFFTEVPGVPGQSKGCMKCNLCAYVSFLFLLLLLSYFPYSIL